MRMMLPAVLAIAAATTVTGCANTSRQDAGTVIGGVLGGVLGSQVGHGRGRTAATIAGALAGGLIGGNVGRSMDELDRIKQQQALETSPTGTTYSWRNPDTHNEYAVTPTRTWESAAGPCREYTTEAVIDGRQEVLHGTACRQNGTWVASN